MKGRPFTDFASQSLFIKSSIQIQQSETLVCIKFPSAFNPLDLFPVTFVLMELSQQVLHNAHLSQKERAALC